MQRFEEIKTLFRLLRAEVQRVKAERRRNTLESPHLLRRKQLTYLTIGAVVVIGGVCFLFSSSASEQNEGVSPSPDQKMAELSTPFKAVDERELWVNRVEKKTAEVKQEAEKIKQENQFLQKRIDVLEDLFKSKKPEQSSFAPPLEAAVPQEDVIAQQAILPQKPSQPQQFPGPSFKEHPQESLQLAPLEPLKKRGPKIAHIGGGKFSSVSIKSADMYLPAGSYSKAVVTSGVAASTATNAQGNPQPMMLRLVDEGNLPRGFKSRVRDAVVLGACYGDISSERVLCRLETMSWVEPNGITVEKKVEGWVIGEDGRAGLRGQVVDRSGDIAREAFGAGILSSIASFFKFEAQTSVFPVTPFGQTNALGKKEALQGAAASGAGNALDKLADFSIKRAEQMQPVIMVASGRVVDIVFKAGVDLSPENQSEMQVMGANPDTNSSEEH